METEVGLETHLVEESYHDDEEGHSSDGGDLGVGDPLTHSDAERGDEREKVSFPFPVVWFRFVLFRSKTHHMIPCPRPRPAVR